MGIVTAALVTGAVLVVATVAGLVWRAHTGRVTDVSGRAESELTGLLGFVSGPAPAEPGTAATLLQFSTDHCAACGPTRRVLGRVASEHDGVTHLDINLTPYPELARRLNIMQTPTTFLFDGAGRVRGRIGGAPRLPELLSALTPILEADHVHS
ncbi:MAG TPA: thioredoxin family protein [Microbacteriaceae bacterium]|nr:thioredoxin family protein [Microbacteriaceae bacterium]